MTEFSITGPIEPLNTTFARIYNHIHAFLVLGFFHFALPSTISDPVKSLSTLLPRICFLQLTYALICLPPAGMTRGLTQTSASIKSLAQNQRKKNSAPGSATLASKIIPAFISQTLGILLGTPVISSIIILHGAPLTTQLLHTLLAGAHISVLATTSLFYVHGVSGIKWQELSGLTAPVDEVNGAAIGTLIGAWLGAIPIPLDWDRDWQKWPVTIVTGAYIGYAIGKLVGSTILKGTRFSHMEDEVEAEEELKLAIESE